MAAPFNDSSAHDDSENHVDIIGTDVLAEKVRNQGVGAYHYMVGNDFGRQHHGSSQLIDLHPPPDLHNVSANTGGQ